MRKKVVGTMSYKEEFIEIYTNNISRSGSQELLYFLENQSNFFNDPASTKYHLAKPGGLVEHSVHVYKRMHWLATLEDLWSSIQDTEPHSLGDSSIAIVALLHDLCKADTYTYLLRPDYDSNSYKKEDPFPFGHGEKSVYIINKFMQLTDAEALAIRYHMSSWNEGEGNTAGRVYEKNLLAFLLHVADEYATFVDEAS